MSPLETKKNYLLFIIIIFFDSFVLNFAIQIHQKKG